MHNNINNTDKYCTAANLFRLFGFWRTEMLLGNRFGKSLATDVTMLFKTCALFSGLELL